MENGNQVSMANKEFKVKPHGILPGNQMVELWRDGKFVAGIYPHQDGIRIVSKYLAGVSEDPSFPPAAIIKLKDGGQS